jgi:hypothetical protein
MPRINDEWRAAVRRVLDEHKLSLRGAMLRTGIDHVTIGKMATGYVPRSETVMRFAQGFGLNIREWLLLAGYEPIEDQAPGENAPPPAYRESPMVKSARELVEMFQETLVELEEQNKPTAAIPRILDAAPELTYESDLEGLDIRGAKGAEDIPPGDADELNRILRAFRSEQRKRQGRG